jgi:hypothetical protein
MKIAATTATMMIMAAMTAA